MFRQSEDRVGGEGLDLLASAAAANTVVGSPQGKQQTLNSWLGPAGTYASGSKQLPGPGSNGSAAAGPNNEEFNLKGGKRIRTRKYKNKKRRNTRRRR